ncbi:MAG TPA: fumarate hydratase [Clostridiales bacterium]|jgi:fumarate hydratase subunit alpha|nr:fumarate hydratase [Clostridiales bacterium]
MREVSFETIAETVARLCVRANTILSPDIGIMLESCWETETSEAGAGALQDIVENFKYAAKAGVPICQDTGMAVVFAEIGQEVYIRGGLFSEAVNEGVRRGYVDGLLRLSVVKDPLRRENTGDNTPAVLHLSLVEGDRIRLTVAPKGFGSENMSAMRMFLPSSTKEEIIDFITETAAKAGSNPCPPMILGVGLGGTIEQAALIAKRAILRPVDERHPDPFYAEMEKKALEKINSLGIGPQGYGGKCTALAVNIEFAPTHIAGLPCVVNMGCHVTRHASAVI